MIFFRKHNLKMLFRSSIFDGLVSSKSIIFKGKNYFWDKKWKLATQTTKKIIQRMGGGVFDLRFDKDLFRATKTFCWLIAFCGTFCLGDHTGVISYLLLRFFNPENNRPFPHSGLHVIDCQMGGLRRNQTPCGKLSSHQAVGPWSEAHP